MNQPDTRHSPPPPAEALAALRVDQAPRRDLWAGIAERLADPAERNHIELPDSLSADLRALRRDAAPGQDLWAAIATRIEDPTLREQIELPASLRDALQTLPRDQAPVRDLWAGIAARIEMQPARRRLPWLAAAVSLAASLVVVFGLVIDRDVPQRTVAAKAPLRPSAEAFAATIGYTRGGEDALALQRASFRPFSREERALVRANLKIVATAEAQIEKAMADDPDDAAYLQELLDSARQHRQGLRAALAERP